MKTHLVAALGIAIAGWMAGGCGSRASLLGAGDIGADETGAGPSGANGANGANGATSGGTGTAGTASQGAGGMSTGGSQSAGQGGASNGNGNGSGPGSGNGSGPGSSGNGAGGAPNGSSGSGTMTCPSFGGPCPDCMSQACPEVYCDCVNNPECVSLLQCASGCGGDDACQQTCMTAHEDGISDLLLLSDCAGSTCDGSCNWGNDVPPCTECILEDCSGELNACLSEPECLQLYYCLDACDNIDLACQQGCYDDHGGGVPTLQTMLECSVDLCQGPCS